MAERSASRQTALAMLSMCSQRQNSSFSLSISEMEALSKADCHVFGHFLLPKIEAFTREGSLGGAVVHGSTV